MAKTQKSADPSSSVKITKKAMGMSKIEKGKKLRLEKNKAKRKRQDERRKKREALGDRAPAKEIPRTIENTREYDVTMVDPNDEEIAHLEMNDEMATYFKRETTPKVLITISQCAKMKTWKFCYELKRCIPNSEMFSRKYVSMKKLVKQALEKNFTDIVIVNENRRKPNAITLCHLPDGPTATFRLSGVKYTEEIKRHGESSHHNPEIVLNNFNTVLGHTIARMLACLFPPSPQFRGRRVVTFHNQRDYIFCRHHRYEFKKEGEKAALLELGPRFTLRLKSLQKGTFDRTDGEYIWILKRHEMETSRRRFFL